MSKGSGRRPGQGYQDGWDRIFNKKEDEMATPMKKSGGKGKGTGGKGKKGC